MVQPHQHQAFDASIRVTNGLLLPPFPASDSERTFSGHETCMGLPQHFAQDILLWSKKPPEREYTPLDPKQTRESAEFKASLRNMYPHVATHQERMAALFIDYHSDLQARDRGARKERPLENGPSDGKRPKGSKSTPKSTPSFRPFKPNGPPVGYTVVFDKKNMMPRERKKRQAFESEQLKETNATRKRGACGPCRKGKKRCSTSHSLDIVQDSTSNPESDAHQGRPNPGLEKSLPHVGPAFIATSSLEASGGATDQAPIPNWSDPAVFRKLPGDLETTPVGIGLDLELESMFGEGREPDYHFLSLASNATVPESSLGGTTCSSTDFFSIFCDDEF